MHLFRQDLLTFVWLSASLSFAGPAISAPQQKQADSSLSPLLKKLVGSRKVRIRFDNILSPPRSSLQLLHFTNRKDQFVYIGSHLSHRNGLGVHKVPRFSASQKSIKLLRPIISAFFGNKGFYPSRTLCVSHTPCSSLH